jgi:hypothetical protein
MKARIIRADGTETEVEPKNGTDFSLEEMQKIVGGYIEIVHVPRSRDLIVLNEEGKLEGLPLNQKATALYANPMDCIVGNVLVCPSDMVK